MQNEHSIAVSKIEFLMAKYFHQIYELREGYGIPKTWYLWSSFKPQAAREKHAQVSGHFERYLIFQTTVRSGLTPIEQFYELKALLPCSLGLVASFTPIPDKVEIAA